MATRKSARSTSGSSASITLEPELRMGSATALRDELSAGIEAGQAVKLDASAVSVADTGALQVLYVFASECRARGVEWSWAGVSDAFHEASRLLGMESALDLPAVPAR